MNRPLRVLLVEDSETDALLLERELARSGFALQLSRVDNREAFEQAIGQDRWDVLITDHNLPSFSSEAALARTRELGLDLPVIIVSGTIGEDVAVAAMKAGASDYIMKDNLARLAPAIDRELREAGLRRQHREAEATIRHLAFHDSLTGLPNRHRFEQRLALALNSAREWNKQHALLYIDLDQFKVVNDTCGHMAGDQLLRQLAEAMQAKVRDSDTLARLGGDEFGLLLEGCPLGRAEELAGQMLQTISDFRLHWDGKLLTVGASIGVAPISALDLRVDDVLRNADIACYLAKEHGRNRFQVYTEDDQDLQRRRGEMQWVARLRWALENDRFVLHRQNIVPLQGGGRPGDRCELLIRLRDEDDQLASPTSFLPAAERFGQAPAIDRWVVNHLLAALASGRPLHAGDKARRFFINLSGVTLNDDSFYDFLREAIRRSGVAPEMLCFEITETAAIGNLDRSVRFMAGIRAEGCAFALDDFGAGLSSFTYLKALPIDYLKIDGAFVRNITTNELDCAIVESVNRVGHVVGLKTIAEFVETDEVGQRLQQIGVDYAQGFGLHRPEALLP